MEEHVLRAGDVTHLYDAVPYRGPDRRRASRPRVTVAQSRRQLSTVLLLVGAHVVVAIAGWLGPESLGTHPEATAWLTVSIATIAAFAGVLHILRWRLFGVAWSLWVGAALLLYAATTTAFPGLVRSFATDNVAAQSWAEVIRPTSVFVTLVLLFLAAVQAHVVTSTGIRPVGAVIVASAALGITASQLEGFRLLFGPAIDVAPVSGTGGLGQVGISFLWAALAVAFLLRHRARAGHAEATLGLMLLALAEARLALGLSVLIDPAWMLASQFCRVFGMTAALAGVVLALQRSFAEQQTTLLESLGELTSVRASTRSQRAAAAERRHDIGGALAGLAGAAIVLERYHERLDATTWAQLTSSLSSEVERLQQMVMPVLATPSTFSLADALQAVAADDVAVDIATPVEVLGKPDLLVERVQRLIDHARTRAPGCAIGICARSRGCSIDLRVDVRRPRALRGSRPHVVARSQRRASTDDPLLIGLDDVCGGVAVEVCRSASGFVFTLPAGIVEGDA